MSDNAEMLALLDEGEEILGTMAEAFGPENFKVLHATDQFKEMIADPTPESVLMAVMYLRWCIKHPNRIGVDSEKSPEDSCGECASRVCEGGFILDDEKANTWRPCYKRMPEVHDAWQKETGYLYD